VGEKYGAICSDVDPGSFDGGFSAGAKVPQKNPCDRIV
jgi:hypothetical protein